MPTSYGSVNLITNNENEVHLQNREMKKVKKFNI